MPKGKPKPATPKGKKLDEARSAAVAADANYLPYDNASPLSAIEKETAKANQALHDYAGLGVARSQIKLIKMYEGMAEECLVYAQDRKRWERDHQGLPAPIEPPTTALLTVNNWSRDFLWVDRVARWDALQAEVQRLEFETDRRAMKAKRIEIIKAAQTRLQAALLQLKPTDASWSETISGLRRMFEQQRIEMGDDLGDGAGDRGHARLLVVRLPAGVSGVAIEDAEDDDGDED